MLILIVLQPATALLVCYRLFFFLLKSLQNLNNSIVKLSLCYEYDSCSLHINSLWDWVLHHAQNQSVDYALTLSFIGNNDQIIVF